MGQYTIAKGGLHGHVQQSLTVPFLRNDGLEGGQYTTKTYEITVY